jgi:stearoyl-CoA desaturase (Delta-9 desaturase)
MTKLGSNFFKMWLPMHVLALASLWWIPNYWVELLCFWGVFGVIGNGVAAHRYFAHGQFTVAKPVHWLLGILTSLAGVGAANQWAIQHKTHHLYADTEHDPHSPTNGFWHTMYGWTLPNGGNSKTYLQHKFAKRLAVKHARDPSYVFFEKYHYTLIYGFCILLLTIDPVLVLIYAAAYALDFIRLGLVNWFCHRSGYRNFETKDHSTNNVWLGWLGMGFGWHNNHHANPGRMILTHRWWEIDVEGYIAWMLSLTAKQTK